MRIIAYELKKIWNIKILGIIIALSVIYFSLSMNDWIRLYSSGRWFGNVELAHHLTENYGSSLSLEDFEDFLNYRDLIVAELDQFFQANAFFAEMGILSFDDLQDFRGYYGSQFETLNDEERNIWNAVFLELGYIVRTEEYGDLTSENETPEAYNKINSFYNIVSFYHTNITRETEWPSHIDSFIEWHQLNESEYRRLTEIRDSGELTSIMTHHTLFHTLRYARNLAALIVFVTLILVSTLVASDRASRVNWLQYSSKQGRRIFCKQFLAVLISAVGATTILVIIFAGIFAATTNAHAFWHNVINSFMGGSNFHWLSVTYGQYVLLMVGVMYLLSVGAAALAFVLSRFSHNNIRLILKIIPLFVAIDMLSNRVLNNFLVVYIGGNSHMQVSLLVALMIAGIVTGIMVVRREKRAELI